MMLDSPTAAENGVTLDDEIPRRAYPDVRAQGLDRRRRAERVIGQSAASYSSVCASDPTPMGRVRHAIDGYGTRLRPGNAAAVTVSAESPGSFRLQGSCVETCAP
jgi:hypothetical protein